MSVIGSNILAGASGAAGGGSKVYVDDVFSTFLYDGTGSAQTITNGIDLSGEGGLVWIKRRSGADPHNLYDTERGVGKILRADRTNAEVTTSNGLTSFNSNGFTLGTDVDGYGSNPSGEDLVAWTFRKAPGFFDIVTFVGNSDTATGTRSIPHNLKSTPGLIILKSTSSGDWYVYHRSIGYEGFLNLNSSNEEYPYNNRWNQNPDANNFYVNASSSYNLNDQGETYVAYIFAHDDAQFGTDEDESIIKFGSYTGTGAANNTVNLGFEPQWVMLKSTSSGNAQPWFMIDNMRGAPSGSTDAYIFANDSQAEADFEIITFNSTGFAIEATGAGTNGSGQNYIYMAIRRPNKPPEAATDVFALHYQNVPQNSWTPGFVPDSLIFANVTGAGHDRFWASRLQGNAKWLYTNQSAGDAGGGNYFKWDDPTNTIKQTYYQGGSDYFINYAFKRAPGFFDVVAYTGTGSATTVTHNLEAIPELMIVKSRSITDHWQVYSSVTDETDFLMLNSNNSTDDQVSKWNDTAPTSSVFTVGTDTGVNQSSATYIAYLFATLSGISKVGSYSGTGNNVNVDCGFTSGARFILIKRTDSSGDWYVWDTNRGIVSGNDPYLLLNSNAAQVTNTDYIDPNIYGFTVTASAPAALNATGGTYLFLAIA